MNFDIVDFATCKRVDSVELADDIFDVPMDSRFLSMHYARMRKKTHVKTNRTKDIADISGTTRKPYKQKHTGNARQGSLRSAQFRGGGIAFGPQAINRFVKLPKAEVRLAKSIVLSEFRRKSALFIVNSANFNSHKTSLALDIVSKYDSDKCNVRILCHGVVTPNSLLAVRNLPHVNYIDVDMLTVHDLTSAHAIVVDSSALNYLIEKLRA